MYYRNGTNARYSSNPRLKGEATFVLASPRYGGIGPEISHPVCSRLWGLFKDPRKQFEYVEGLALRMGGQRIVAVAFVLVEQCLGNSVVVCIDPPRSAEI
jgi:hypothetical protein